MVLRHEIDYKAPACLGDDVVLRTWVGKSTRLTFERFTEIRRSGDDQLLSKARTLWCPINAQTGAADPRAGGSARAVFDLNSLSRSAITSDRAIRALLSELNIER